MRSESGPCLHSYTKSPLSPRSTSAAQVVKAGLLIIGNEILSGRTQDTNLRDLANILGEWGIRVAEARVIADDEAMIVSAVRDFKDRYDYVFTTGE